MPRTLEGRTFYKFAEALAQADISRSTYKRWLKEQRITDVRFRDRNNARLFTEEELDALGKLGEIRRPELPRRNVFQPFAVRKLALSTLV